MTKRDQSELQHFKKIIKAGNAGNVNQEIEDARAHRMFRITQYDDRKKHVLNEFMFQERATAEEAVAYVKKLLGRL